MLQAVFLAIVLTRLSETLGQDIECYPNHTIEFSNPNSVIYTHFSAFYDVASTRNYCSGSAADSNDKFYFDCGSTTSTITVYLSDRSLSDNILGGKILACAFKCSYLTPYEDVFRHDLNVNLNETSKPLTPTYNITSGLYTGSLDAIVTEAVVGDVIYLIITSPAEYDLVPLKCNATGSGGESVTLIHNGCSEDANFMTSFTVTPGSLVTTYNTTFYVFKFYGSDTLLLACDVMVCTTRKCAFTCGGGRKKRGRALPRARGVKHVNISTRLRILDRALGGSDHASGSVIMTTLMYVSTALLKIHLG